MTLGELRTMVGNLSYLIDETEVKLTYDDQPVDLTLESAWDREHFCACVKGLIHDRTENV